MDEWVFVAGTTGFEDEEMKIAEIRPQLTRQTFRDIEWALAKLAVRRSPMSSWGQIHVPNSRQTGHRIMSVLAEILGCYPTRPQWQYFCGLVEERMKI